MRMLWLSFLLFTATSTSLRSQVFNERYDDWPVDLKINGTIVVAEVANPTVESLESLLAGSPKPSLTLLTDITGQALAEQVAKYSRLCSSVQLAALNASVDQVADAPRDILVWQDTQSLSDISKDTLERIKRCFVAHVERGGTLLVFGPQAKSLAKFYVKSIENALPVIHPGMNLLPDTVLDTALDSQGVGRPQLQSVLACHPRCVGIGLDKETMLILQGRKLRALGPGQAVLMLNANERLPVRVQSISQASATDRNRNRNLADLTEWRRDAIDRTLEPFPPEAPEIPVVESGTLMIVGGGGTPNGLMSQFVESAGGVEHAKLVYVPCEEIDELEPVQSMVRNWEMMGVKHATFIHTKNRAKANEDESLLGPLREATGIWFGGGRQWNLADSYYGTKAHQLMKEVLHRGGVIGGSSAGASIQARYLARATPIENFKIMAPGYERGGLGFLSGVAIDQHFSQRQRQPDMTQLVNRYPQLLGIGIDESTAIVVRGSIAQVVGRGKVHFYDRTQPVFPDRPDFSALAEGQSYDLAKRSVVQE
jgi:cyanophycinase